jgi:hypothetical protein
MQQCRIFSLAKKSGKAMAGAGRRVGDFTPIEFCRQDAAATAIWNNPASPFRQSRRPDLP